MLLLSHDANYSKNQSETDLKKHQAKINNVRKDRMLEIQTQKQEVENRVKKQQMENDNEQKTVKHNAG